MYPKYLTYLARLGTPNLHPKGKKASELLIEKLELRDGLSILDFGCGTGETIVRIASKYDVRIDGIDAIPEMLKTASRRIRSLNDKRNIKLYQTDFNMPLPFDDESYDRAYSESVLGFQSFNQIQFLLKEVHRVLKNDGLFVMNEAIWKQSASKKIIDEINKFCIEDFGLCQASEDEIYLEDWLRLMEESKFKVISYESLENIGTLSKKNGVGKFNPELMISRFITFSSRAREFINPAIRKQIRGYKSKLKKHKDDGKYIESRLFVLKKKVNYKSLRI